MLFLIQIKGFMPMERDKALPEKAIRIPVRRVDERYFPDPEAYNRKLPDKWEDQGQNHRLTKNGIARDFEDSAWVLDLDSAEEMLFFLETTPCIIKRPRVDFPDLPVIEIIDDPESFAHLPFVSNASHV